MNTAEFKSYWDLLQPKWRGKILFMDPKSSSLGLNAATSLFNDPDIGPEFLKRLFTEMDVAISGNRRQGTDWLSSGKYYICFACRDTEMAIKQGLPVGEVDPLSLKEGANEIGGGSGAVRTTIGRARILAGGRWTWRRSETTRIDSRRGIGNDSLTRAVVTSRMIVVSRTIRVVTLLRETNVS